MRRCGDAPHRFMIGAYRAHARPTTPDRAYAVNPDETSCGFGLPSSRARLIRISNNQIPPGLPVHMVYRVRQPTVRAEGLMARVWSTRTECTVDALEACLSAPRVSLDSKCRRLSRNIVEREPFRIQTAGS